jgi:hypothetical protein
MENKIVIKRIPGDWIKTNKDIYILYLGETDNEAGRRLTIPFRESVVLHKDSKGRRVKILEGKKKMIIGNSDFSLAKEFEMKLTGNYSDSKRWEVDIEDKTLGVGDG